MLTIRFILQYMIRFVIILIFASLVCNVWSAPNISAAQYSVNESLALDNATTEIRETMRSMDTNAVPSKYGYTNGNSATINVEGDNVLAEELTMGQHTVNLTRHHDGDVFLTNEAEVCNADTCISLSSGTAGLLEKKDILNRATNEDHLLGEQLEPNKRKKTSIRKHNDIDADICHCRCLPYMGTYREDLGICVDDIHECTLSPFVSGTLSEKIPFVFLPLRGQIIYPSREISFPDIRTPVCAVTGAQYLTTNGWSDLRNPIDADYPFRMFRDEGRTFLQWLGETDLRQKLQGRLIVVHLICRDMALLVNVKVKDQIQPLKKVFSSCVAFRVNGSPVKYNNNVTEVLFQSEATATLASTSEGMSTKEYIVIATCSLLLALIYMSSVFIYIQMKKRRNREQIQIRRSLEDITNGINYPKCDQTVFGTPFNRSGSVYSAVSLPTSNEPLSPASIGSLKEEMGIIKNNPLLQHFPQLDEYNSGFTSDVSNSNSECDIEGEYHKKLKQMQTSALVHPQKNVDNLNDLPQCSHGNNSANVNCGERTERSSSPTQESECLPADNISVIDEMMSEEKLENLRAIVNGNIRKKLYFNPAYFEPHLLAQPPPAAVEFLQKIREVITIAKYKMATKRYQPSLIMIPEEGQPQANQPSTHVQSPASECQACVDNRCNWHAKNCGDKRNSIEKWLQSVPTTDLQGSSNSYTQQTNANGGGDTNLSYHKMNSKCSVVSSMMCSSTNPLYKEVSSALVESSLRASSSTEEKRLSTFTSGSVEATDSVKNIHHIDHYTHTVGFPSVTIPVRANCETFTMLSAEANKYGFAETGSEIYNNPKFTLHDSPAASQRSHSSHRSRKRVDVFDPYTGAPAALTERQHYEMLQSMKQIPLNIEDGMARDYNGTLTTNASSESFQLDIPTPDYDSTLEKKIKDIYNNTQSSVPSVPTPDYSTLSRKSHKQCQPDSPIFRRKSPQYLIVDYETNSIEHRKVTQRKSSQSSSSPSSDVSSQLSPSLSTALPLEEELEINHTMYNKVNDAHKGRSLNGTLAVKTEVNSKNQKDISNRIKYDTPFLGSMTIEVDHEPLADSDRSPSSDHCNTNTLNCKQRKQSFCDINTWSKQNKIGQGKESTSVCSNRSDTANLNRSEIIREQVAPDIGSTINTLQDLYQIQPAIHSNQQSCKCGVQAGQRLIRNIEAAESRLRLLTLEAKHSRRQRVSDSLCSLQNFEGPNESLTKTTIKICTPNLGHSAIKSRRLPESPIINTEDECISVKNKSFIDNNPMTTSIVGNSTNKTYVALKKLTSSSSTDSPPPSPGSIKLMNQHTATEEETMSIRSESTELTGLSGTLVNSEVNRSCSNTISRETLKDDCDNDFSEPKENVNTRQCQSTIIFHSGSDLGSPKAPKTSSEYSPIFNTQINGLRSDYSLTKYLNRRKSQVTEQTNTSCSKFHSDNNNAEVDSIKLDVLSTSSHSNRNNNHLSDRTKEMYRNAGVPVGIAYPQRSNSISSSTSVQNVYRCEIEPVHLTHGMQIAMGLKDRAKKTKDLKNAWRKFVSRATSKFSPTQSPAPSFEKKASNLIEVLEHDEGILSLLDNHPEMIIPPKSSYTTPTFHEQRFGPRSQEMDSGYMSADSGEVYKKSFYDRYNFKVMSARDHIIRVDTIEDNSDGGNISPDENNQIDPSETMNNILENHHFKNIQPLVAPTPCDLDITDNSDSDSDKTLTHTDGIHTSYSSEENDPSQSTSNVSSETDDETHPEDMWESGAESVETHSVLYKNIKKYS